MLFHQTEGGTSECAGAGKTRSTKIFSIPATKVPSSKLCVYDSIVCMLLILAMTARDRANKPRHRCVGRTGTRWRKTSSKPRRSHTIGNKHEAKPTGPAAPRQLEITGFVARRLTNQECQGFRTFWPIPETAPVDEPLESVLFATVASIIARPKSQSFATPAPSTSTFALLTSRWMILSSWRKSRA